MVEVLKMSNVGKVNSKLQFVKGILKVIKQIVCCGISTRSVHYSSEILYMYYTVFVTMIGCGLCFYYELLFFRSL